MNARTLFRRVAGALATLLRRRSVDMEVVVVKHVEYPVLDLADP